MRVIVVGTASKFAAVAVDAVCHLVQEQPEAVLALPSGNTPLGLYDELARRVERDEVDFGGVTAFAIDELHGVPRQHPATNAWYCATHITTPLKLRALHVMNSADPDADDECARFTDLIADAGGLDLAVLGIGVNGHLAFNEPGCPLDSDARRVKLERSTREAYINAFGSFDATPQFGLTLGIADLMAARRVLLLAAGSSKARAIAEAIEGPVTQDTPASVLQQHSDVTVVLDKEASALLEGDY